MLTKESTGLILVDIQVKLARLVHDSDALVSNCEKLIKGVQALDLPIIWLEQNPGKLGSTVDELSSLLEPQAPVVKYTFDGCEEAQFFSHNHTQHPIFLYFAQNWRVFSLFFFAHLA